MGAAPSSGTNNDELIDALIDNNYIHYRSSEFAFRIVDRGDYFPEEKRDNAYKDQAWRSDHGSPGHIHFSAPCIYANALEYLDLRPGLSFLNIGSGSGYFNAVAGFLLTESGTNHGVELFENMVDYAEQMLRKNILRPATSAFSFCEPEFFNGSAFYIENKMLYDRIYCGALVPNNHRVYFCQMLKVGGILVMPYGSRLLQIVRKDTYKYFVYRISNVTFSQLVSPTTETSCTLKPVQLPSTPVKTLAELCRTTIRAHIRRKVFATHPIQMQFEIGLTKEIDDQDNEESQMERIGTFYFADRRNREANGQPERENQEAPNEQNPEVNEEMFDQPVNEDAHTPEEIRNLLRTPPPAEQQNVEPQNEVEEGPEREHSRENFEAWTPEHERRQNEPEHDELMEDGLDAEAAALAQERNDNDRQVEQQPEPIIGIREQPLHPNVNRFQIRRQRLHVNLVNGNRLIGFLNQADDEEEEDDLFNLAEDRVAPKEPIGLAFYDKSVPAVFHITNVRPSLDNIDMKQILPNYESPKPRLLKARSSEESPSYRDASTVTEDIRTRRPRFDVRIAMRPLRNDNPQQRLLLRHAHLETTNRSDLPPNQQPSTSSANQDSNVQETSVTAGTQTEGESPMNMPNNPVPLNRMAPLEAVHHIFQGLHHGIDALQQRRQRIGQLRDRLRRFNNVVPQSPQASTTAAATASSTPTTATASSASVNRSGLKRKIDEDSKSDDANVHITTNKGSNTSMAKISRSASLPDCSQEPSSTSEMMSNFLFPNRQMQSQTSSLRPVSPVLSNSSVANDPSSPSSIATTVSSDASSIRTGNTASTSSRGSAAISDISSGDVSSLAGGSTASSAAPTASTVETRSSSGFGTDDQQSNEEKREEKCEKERAERSHIYRQQLDDFHEEYQRCLKSLPLSERLYRFVSYEN